MLLAAQFWRLLAQKLSDERMVEPACELASEEEQGAFNQDWVLHHSVKQLFVGHLAWLNLSGGDQWRPAVHAVVDRLIGHEFHKLARLKLARQEIYKLNNVSG